MKTALPRVVWIVLDGVGIGALPDAADYGDQQAATLQNVAAACGGLHLPHLQRLGLGHLGEFAGVAAEPAVTGAYGRLAEQSAGKDSTTGHWELAGVHLQTPFATYPQGFPEDLLDAFAGIAGLPALGNVAASGTNILGEFGLEHLRSGRPIVYTSVDSVFQIAAHEEVLPPEELYALCRKVRRLVDSYRIGRVIARPFTGDCENGFRRTSRRKDFSMPPPQPTVLDRLAEQGHKVHTVGKIGDLFAGRGITTEVASRDNADGMAKLLAGVAKLAPGDLLLGNLIDFDMAYGHRRDAVGFGGALEVFDAWLPQMMAALRPADLLLVTADHGCDPTTPGTDHTREYVPVLAWTPGLAKGIHLGDRSTFADVGATIADCLGLNVEIAGRSFWGELRG